MQVKSSTSFRICQAGGRSHGSTRPKTNYVETKGSSESTEISDLMGKINC